MRIDRGRDRLEKNELGAQLERRESELRGAEPAVNSDSFFGGAPAKRLRLATSADNAQILSQIRELVRRELGSLTVGGEFDIKKANILHKLAQTYAILDAHVDKEHKKYDYSQESTEKLARMELDALAHLGK